MYDPFLQEHVLQNRKVVLVIEPLSSTFVDVSVWLGDASHSRSSQAVCMLKL